MGKGGELATVAVFSRGLFRLRGLKAFLGARRLVFAPGARRVRELDAVVGWGHKPTADRARAYARKHGVPYVALEDGFLRSVGLGPHEPPLSLVIDDLGIYYDATGPSRIEALLAYDDRDDPLVSLRDRARACRERIVEARLSKYNDAPDALPERWKKRDRPVVLVVDQTFDDASVTQGLGGPRTFERMLEAALEEHPDARIIVKLHPATMAGKRGGYLVDRCQHVECLAEAVNPIALLQEVDAVYVCSSQLGFEALMVGKPVACFGAPFYAGWGLTRDEVRVPRRGRRRSIDDLAAAALLLYPRYLHPMSEKACEAEDVIEHLALQRRSFADNARTYYCVGFSTWKRPFVRRYLSSGRVHFVSSWRALRRRSLEDDAAILIWGSRGAPAVRARSGAALPVYRMEDGFLRSVRLGSQLTPPGSLVVDRSGLYYDPSRPSDLEKLLMEARFSDAELARAARLREQIVRLGVSKYNLPAAPRFRPRAEGKPVVLVVGQVEDDASVRLGSPKVRDNATLLAEARRLRPDAHIVYRPHPEVLARYRRGSLEGAPWDELGVGVSVSACLAAVDEVHTMTSLVGFEALLRGVRVVTHGLPFYAGWGLTEDRLPMPRRTRRLALDELVAGTLLFYPRYFSWRAKAFCTAEDMVGELARAREHQLPVSFELPWLLRRCVDVAILCREWIHA